MPNEVIVRLNGGLGNQMFQYAAGLGLASRQGRALAIDTSVFASYKDWPYQLDRLKVPQNIQPPPASRRLFPGSLPARVVRKLTRGRLEPKDLYREPHYHFDPTFFDLEHSRTVIEGYFQSPLYFEHVSSDVRDRFQPLAPLTATAQEWLHRIGNAPVSASIHVRRGDYLKSANAIATHGSLDLAYYKRAISLIEALEPRRTLFVFSDDPGYVKQAFEGVSGLEVVQSDASAPWEDMFLMARCHHNIIANSSYSWWGAWLNSNPGKRVIAPAKWFAPARLATTNVLDVYPDDWILLK